MNEPSYQEYGVGEVNKYFVAFANNQELGDDAVLGLISNFGIKLS